MNNRIKELIQQAGADSSGKWLNHDHAAKLVELVVQDCANFVREEYDHEDAEGIAWYMEIKFGLHGDYA